MGLSLQRIGKYSLQERLGGHERVEVWKALEDSRGDPLRSPWLPASDDPLRSPVVLHIFRDDPQGDLDFLPRFLRESKTLLTLQHSNITRIRDAQLFQSPELKREIAYLVMDYIDGPTLAQYMRANLTKGVLPSASDTVHLVTAIGKGIDYAHRAGIIHSDLQPQNIHFDQSNTLHNRLGEPLITGFGKAKLLGTTASTLALWGLDTPLYLSPEQCRGSAPTAASDIYALGAILYEMYAGRPPFQGENVSSIMLQQAHEAPQSPALFNPDIPPALSAIILHCLEKNPQSRFPNASLLAQALSEVLLLAPHGKSISVRDPQNSTLSQFPTSQPATTPQGESVNDPPTRSSSPTSTNMQPDIPAAPAAKAQQKPPLQAPLSIPLLQRWAKAQKATGSFHRLGQDSRLLILISVVLVLLITTSSTLFFLKSGSATSPPNMIGHVYFLSSWQLDQAGNQGINDEVRIVLQNLPAPSANHSYYAYLLGDGNQSQPIWIPLGPLTLNHGNVDVTLPNNGQHMDLLQNTSRFLLTEEDVRQPVGNPFLDQTTWRYYAELPQKLPSPRGLSMLDYLRDLLVQSPELASTAVTGGLTPWLLRNVEEISRWSTTARDNWKNTPTLFIRQQLVNILYYLDGACAQANVQSVPSGTPTTPSDTIFAQNAHFAVLNPCAQEMRKQPPSLQALFGQTPYDALDHLAFYMQGILHSPGVSGPDRSIAEQAIAVVGKIKVWLQQLRTDSMQIINLNDEQFTRPATLNILGDIAQQARFAYAGRTDEATGNMQPGAAWLFDNIQRLASFDVSPYGS